MGFLIEKAGGVTNDTNGCSVLETKILGYKQRLSFIAGNAFEVKKVSEMMKVN
jgi:fructose-1,6-bisphosphatase